MTESKEEESSTSESILDGLSSSCSSKADIDSKEMQKDSN